MENSSYIGLINNAILLLALGVIYPALGIDRIQRQLPRKLVMGLLIGGAGIAVMLVPWQLAPGIFFDTRWVVMSLSGLFFGFLPTLIAAVITILFRLLQGGEGALLGSLIILLTATLGLSWRYLLQDRVWSLGWLPLYLFGIVIEVAVVGCLLLLPAAIRWTVIYSVAPPILLVFPVGTMLLGLLLIRQEQLRRANQDVRFKNSLLATQQEASADGILTLGRDGEILSRNGRFSELWGLSERLMDVPYSHPVLGFISEQIDPSDRFMEDFHRLQQDTETISGALVHLKKGQLFESYTAPLSGENGVHFGRLWSFRDITDRQQTEQALAASQLHYRTIIESLNAVGEGLLIVNAAGQIEYMNQTMIEWFGDHTGEPCKHSIASLDSFRQYPPAVPPGGNQTTLCYQPVAPDGRHFEVVGTPIANPDGSISTLEVVRDITERKRHEEQIRTLSQVVEQSPVSVVITDTDGYINYVNRTFERLTGYQAAEVIGQHTRLFKSGNTPEGHYQELWRTIKAGDSWKGEFENKKKSGELFWEQLHVAPVLDETGESRYFLAVKEDVTLQKAQQERILQQAHFDVLTGLPNRFLSLDRLDRLTREAGRSGHRVAVLFLDLDDFKKVNDTLGHDVGDQLLKKAAERLTATVRDYDTVGRLGGDEFLVLLGGLDEINSSGQVAELMLEQFHRPFSMDGHELVLTASVGVAIYPEDGLTAAELLRYADTAMYCSKEAGGNTYHYYTNAMNRGVARRLALEEQLRGALDRGEFQVVYQPQFEIPGRRMIGTEALLRWKSETLGDVSPAEFIPVAEQTGLILEIGRFVITTALAQLAAWRKRSDRKLRMAVNVSPRQFRDPQLVGFVEQSLKRVGIEPECLELEITEGVLMSGQTHIDIALTAINRLGLTIAMDDFGTGYSSLSYLRSYPFDILKIDRSFINGLTEDMADDELVNATIAMAHGLGLKVVAEGVETEAQLHYLSSQGCDYAQGYLLSRPLGGEAIPALLQEELGVRS